MKGGCLASSSVRLRIAFADSPLLSGDGSRGRGIGAFNCFGGAYHFSRGGGERLGTMISPTNSSLNNSIGALLVDTMILLPFVN